MSITIEQLAEEDSRREAQRKFTKLETRRKKGK